MKFRKKPIEVEAYQWFEVAPYKFGEQREIEPYESPYKDDSHLLCDHCGIIMHNHGWMDTNEGGYRVCPGDWIITGIAGERYPCKNDIFLKTYEPI